MGGGPSIINPKSYNTLDKFIKKIESMVNSKNEFLIDLPTTIKTIPGKGNVSVLNDAFLSTNDKRALAPGDYYSGGNVYVVYSYPNKSPEYKMSLDGSRDANVQAYILTRNTFYKTAADAYNLS